MKLQRCFLDFAASFFFFNPVAWACCRGWPVTASSWWWCLLPGRPEGRPTSLTCGSAFYRVLLPAPHHPPPLPLVPSASRRLGRASSRVLARRSLTEVPPSRSSSVASAAVEVAPRVKACAAATATVAAAAACRAAPRAALSPSLHGSALRPSHTGTTPNTLPLVCAAEQCSAPPTGQPLPLPPPPPPLHLGPPASSASRRSSRMLRPYTSSPARMSSKVSHRLEVQRNAPP
jgi:hypothetical protein